MEWLDQITSIVTGLTFIGVIISVIWNQMSYRTIRTNDLKHLEEDVKKILVNQEKTDTKIDNLEKSVSYLKGAHATQLEVIQHLSKK